MSASPQIKGWCPGALTPMMSGDGLVVRIRPRAGRLRRAQADGIASLAAAHGNGMLDLSSRANIQIRGVTEESHPALIEGLGHMSLLDATPQIEARRNILVTPFWQPGDETEALMAALTDALARDDAPNLPVKFGFAVDTGPQPVLQTASADIRFERGSSGELLLRADGASAGKPVTEATMVSEAIKLAEWFSENRQGDTRMRRAIGRNCALPPDHIVPLQKQTYQPAPGHTPQGILVGLAFGQLTVETLAALAKHGGLRLTPWRMLLVEGARRLPDIDGLITVPDDPLLRVVACTGAPRCDQAQIETRSFARNLAPHIQNGQLVHVSGCAKGCAHPAPAALTVTGTKAGLNLIHNGRAGDTPQATGLSPNDIFKAI